MLNGRQLRTLFRQFNQQYWNDQLPPYSIRVVKHITGGTWGRCLKKKRLIQILSGLSREDTISTLLHEMAHAAARGYHDMPWKKEMIRLREAGAPLSGDDRIVSLDDRNGRAISKKLFRGVMVDLLLEVPTVNLNQAVKWFIHEAGGPKTIKGFLKRYPWARQIFETVKRDSAAFDKQEAELRRMFAKNPPATAPVSD